MRETTDGFHGVIEDAHWMNAAGDRFKTVPGVFPLFTCLEPESVVVDDGPFVRQSFVISDGKNAEFAHRALVTLLKWSVSEDDVRWRRALEQRFTLPYAAGGLREAAQQALNAGFIQYFFDFKPAVMPDFLTSLA